jgi:hypothetical protein
MFALKLLRPEKVHKIIISAKKIDRMGKKRVFISVGFVYSLHEFTAKAIIGIDFDFANFLRD